MYLQFHWEGRRLVVVQSLDESNCGRGGMNGQIEGLNCLDYVSDSGRRLLTYPSDIVELKNDWSTVQPSEKVIKNDTPDLRGLIFIASGRH